MTLLKNNNTNDFSLDRRNKKSTKSVSEDRPTGRYGLRPRSAGNCRSLTDPTRRRVFPRPFPRSRPKWTRSPDAIVSPRDTCKYSSVAYGARHFLLAGSGNKSTSNVIRTRRREWTTTFLLSPHATHGCRQIVLFFSKWVYRQSRDTWF